MEGVQTCTCSRPLHYCACVDSALLVGSFRCPGGQEACPNTNGSSKCGLGYHGPACAYKCAGARMHIAPHYTALHCTTLHCIILYPKTTHCAAHAYTHAHARTRTTHVASYALHARHICMHLGPRRLCKAGWSPSRGHVCTECPEHTHG